jgi:hypothetical protein
MEARLAEIVKDPRHVRLDARRLEQVAARTHSSIETRWWEEFRTTDEHYKQPLTMTLNDRDAVQFAIVGASQGWLIWQKEPDGQVIPLTIRVGGETYAGAWALTACHMRSIRQGQNILDPDVLAGLTMKDVVDHYRDETTGQVTVQSLEERLENFREVGRVLRDEFGGHFVNVLKRAGGYLYRADGQGLIQLLVTKFPKSFGDWPMAKLPNVTALGLVELRASRTLPREIDQALDFKDIENLEGGADYYRPWFFVRVGVFDISEEFKRKLRAREMIEPGSQMEEEFRAFTIRAMRELAGHAGGWPQALPGLEVETHAQAFLRCRRCRVGIGEKELPCSYRPVCKATHDDHELMDCGWPLVMTTEY